jgi:lipopolysaccharide transport system permease protein
MHEFSVLKSLSLAWMLARRDIKNRYVSSYAGMAWHVGVPLIYAMINVVVFSILMNGRMGVQYSEIPFALFYFLPLSLWSFFADVVSRSTGILREYSYLINKIAFPSWVLPMVPLASALINQAVILCIVCCLMVYYGVEPSLTAPAYLLIWLVCLMMALGAAYGVAALAVFIPDLGQIVPVCLNIVFWMTPILYPATLVEHAGGAWLKSIIMHWNPFFYIVEFSRNVVFGSEIIQWHEFTVSLSVSMFTLLVGAAIFRKLKAGFADVI